ncbi:unnamed protein product [Hymenolepis diminuta]|uniref:EamA domain-containing protein n=1 Tax=Hymenolepis diminuta TaxID=6216 RepID=A0A564XVZ7_HYMDI|nr:unnamed protein product [Hymenolepis diminuta]
MLSVILAIASGVLAASSAAWTKIAQQPDFEFYGYKDALSESARYVIQFGIFTFGNILMWLMFVTALKKSPNVVIVVILNNVANLYLSAFYGWWLFRETISVTWFFGALFLTVGCCLMYSPSKEVKKE